MSEEQLKGILNELATQRAVLGDRAASLAGENAALRSEIELLKARIAEIEPKPEPAPELVP